MSNETPPISADTFSLKAFVSIGAFADNTRYETAPLGELSLNSATYSKDRGIFSTTGSGSNPTAMDLLVFSCRTTEDKHYDVPAPYANLLLDVIRWSHQQSVSGSLNGEAETYRQQIMAQYDGKIGDAVVGPMVTQDGVWLPSHVTFYIRPDSIGATWTPEQREPLERSRVKLWFSDQAFSTQYDEYEIEFIAPIANDRLDDFFLLADQVKQRVSQRTPPELATLIHVTRNGKPETKTITSMFQYHDPQDRDHKIDTYWTFVTYGKAGDNVDSIKEGLANWILANSTRTREQWALLFPDIFTSTEFIIVPQWNQYAVPNMTLQAGVYSPVINVQGARAMARRACTGTNYTEQHVDNTLATFGTPYKSLGMLAVGGPENRDEVDRFEEQWPDYMAVSTTSIDFNRMQQRTQDFINLLYRLLQVAETMTDFSDLPQDMTRLKRTNAAGETFMYVVANMENVQYLIASRQSVQQYFPPSNTDALQITSEGAIGVVAMPNADIAQGTYETFFKAVGGKAPYKYTLIGVSDVHKLGNATIDDLTGAFEAEPLAAGDITVSVSVEDGTQAVATKTFTLHLYTGASA